MKYLIFIGSLAFIISMGLMAAAEKPDKPKTSKIEPPRIGNLSLPSSQTPGPLFSFGHILVDKGDKLAYLYGVPERGCHKKSDELLASALFGITDTISIQVSFPYEARICENGIGSSGIGDCSIAAQMGFYSKVTESVWQSGSFFLELSIPTGSDIKNPATGLGAPSVLTGLVFDQTGTDWLFFTSQGILWNTQHRGIKYGNEYLYQFGMGKNISYCPDKWIFTAIVELFGAVAGRTMENCIADPNSGGNIIFLGPSIFFSTPRFSLQAGIAGVIHQDLNGIQNKERFAGVVGVGWKF